MKKFKLGFELEMFTLNKKGEVVSKGDVIIKRIRKDHPEIWTVHECGRHMIEFGVKPSTSFLTFKRITNHLKKAMKSAEKNKVLLFPFATYPGNFNPEFNDSIWYNVKQRILGNKFKMAGLCNGYHVHLSLPSGVFNSKNMLRKSKNKTYKDPKKRLSGKNYQEKYKEKESVLINGHNLLTAADPVLTTFMQSSPFIQGKHLAKDSRMLFYRGGKNLGFNGLYSKFQIFGGLQSYIETLSDVIKLIERRYDLWKSEIIKQGFSADLIRKHGRKLDYAWNPVKINKKGTLEQRGMDMNLPSYALGVSTLLENAYLRMRKENLTAIPCDEGMKEPFKVKGNLLLIPPENYVRNELQYKSAIKGIEDPEMYNYCDCFVKFAMQRTNKKTKKLTFRIYEILRTRKTVADQLLDQAIQEGVNINEKVPDKIAKHLAVHWSNKLKEDIQFTERLLESYKNTT